MKQSTYAITSYQLQKHYEGGTEEAGLNGFDLEVRTGSICGLLGPNGAGKTTAIKILSTLLRPDSGRATVAGFDISQDALRVRQNIGLVGQYAAIDETLTGRQNLVMFGRLYHLSNQLAQKRADELLDQFALKDAAKIPVTKYSGGMRRRLDIAVSLITSPPVLFVDEPTTGLDPISRREVWHALQSRVANGTTILLTTQYLEEADYLADRVVMLKLGKVVAEGTPDELKTELGGDWLDITLTVGTDMDVVTNIVRKVTSDAPKIDPETNRISVPVEDRTRALVTVVKLLSETEIVPQDISLRRPTLDEVFIHLTDTKNESATLEVTS